MNNNIKNDNNNNNSVNINNSNKNNETNKDRSVSSPTIKNTSTTFNNNFNNNKPLNTTPTSYNPTNLNIYSSRTNSTNNNITNNNITNNNSTNNNSTNPNNTTNNSIHNKPSSPTTRADDSTSYSTQLSSLQEDLKRKDDKMDEYENTICDLRTSLNDRLVELNTIKHKWNKSPERNLTGSLKEKTLEREQTLDRLKKKHLDVEKLKSVVETLMIANEEKNAKLDEMRAQLDKFQLLAHKLHDLEGGSQLMVECGVEDAATPNGVQPYATSTPVSVYSAISNKSNSCTNIQQREIKTPPSTKRKTVSSTSHQFDDNLKDELAQQYKHLQTSSNHTNHRKRSTGRSIRRLFNRLRRSTSQEVDDKPDDFKRSTAVRSTAGPRLSGWINKANSNLATWDIDSICAWFVSMGLSCYVGDVRKVVKNGEQLLNASSHQMEKELGIKNPYHRRKLQLAMQVMTSDPNNAMCNMDHHAVQRWLDDIGLPQYKDPFMAARLDGRMLNYLTHDDLLNLKVTNQLHQLSIRSSTYVLRSNNFNINSLIRRPFPEELNKLAQTPPTNQISLWTNHRVMDWLRLIDLSEYAPNLRGSGVHGGLMVLEPRFSAEILAAILSIPSNKSLLRRHLTTHFVSLVGGKVQHAKRTYGVQNPDLPILTTNLKVKALKKSSLFRGKSSFKGDFVCPLDPKLLPWTRELLIATNESEAAIEAVDACPDVVEKTESQVDTNLPPPQPHSELATSDV